MFMFGKNKRSRISQSLDRIKKNFVSAEDLQYEQVKKQNELMLKHNVSMSRIFQKEKEFLKRMRKNSVPQDRKAFSDSEDSIDEVMKRMNFMPARQQSMNIIAAVEKRVKLKRMYNTNKADKLAALADKNLTQHVLVVQKPKYGSRERNKSEQNLSKKKQAKEINE